MKLSTKPYFLAVFRGRFPLSFGGCLLGFRRLLLGFGGGWFKLRGGSLVVIVIFVMFAIGGFV